MDSISNVYWLLRVSFRRQGYRDTLANQKKKKAVLTRGRGEESITPHRQPDLSITPDLPLSRTHFLCFQNRAQQQGKTHLIGFYSLIIRAFYSLIILCVTGCTLQPDAYHINAGRQSCREWTQGLLMRCFPTPDVNMMCKSMHFANLLTFFLFVRQAHQCSDLWRFEREMETDLPKQPGWQMSRHELRMFSS